MTYENGRFGLNAVVETILGGSVTVNDRYADKATASSESGPSDRAIMLIFVLCQKRPFVGIPTDSNIPRLYLVSSNNSTSVPDVIHAGRIARVYGFG